MFPFRAYASAKILPSTTMRTVGISGNFWLSLPHVVQVCDYVVPFYCLLSLYFIQMVVQSEPVQPVLFLIFVFSLEQLCKTARNGIYLHKTGHFCV